MTEYILPFLFFFVALIYSSVGLGGGSSYTAIMAIFGTSYQTIPTTSLTMNLVVTFIGMINYWRNGYGRIDLIVPFLIMSIPMVYLGGILELPEKIFQILLLITLFLVAIRIYVLNDLKFSFQLSGIQKWIFIFGLGAVLGFVAGTVGIGGGIYLVPLIIMFGLGSEKEAAAAGSMFIWVNSLVGLIARSQVFSFDTKIILPLSGAVFIGGAVIQWIRDELKLIDNAEESEKIALSVNNTGGVYVVPALIGSVPIRVATIRTAVLEVLPGSVKVISSLNILKGTGSPNIVELTISLANNFERFITKSSEMPLTGFKRNLT